MRSHFLHSCAGLLTVLLAVQLIACSEGNDVTTSVVETERITNPVETEPAEIRVMGPDKTDLNGYKFRIATTTWINCDKMICADTMNGEIINDTLYEANARVFEDYNCAIELITDPDYTAMINKVSKSVKAGSDDFDLSYNHDNRTVQNAMAGLFLDVRDCDVFNFEAPWWTSTKDSFTVGGSMYFVSNYLTYSSLYLGMALCYNKDMARDLQVEIPYQDIFDGNWYMSDLIALSKEAYSDMNSDGTMDAENDRFGFISTSLGLVNFQISLGSSLLAKDEEGYLEYHIDTEQNIAILNKYEELMQYSVLSTLTSSDYGVKEFGNGHALFNYLQIRNIPETLHHTDVRYGILPAPKLDESQDDYISGAFDVYWGIPKTAYENQDTIATILEAMSHQCYYEVLPVVYESVLKVKFSDSPDDAKMFDLIRSSMSVDVGYAFNEYVKGLDKSVRMLSTMDSGNVVSSFEKSKQQIDKMIEKLNNKIREMNEDM